MSLTSYRAAPPRDLMNGTMNRGAVIGKGNLLDQERIAPRQNFGCQSQRAG
jgi:hypothetical protein